ncbi:MAG: DNA adenine methylase [Bacteroidetes bacterium]|nr:DNA adenine methylase [Bacteroidota bacterium]
MTFYSPLRYPGGKNKLAKFVALICQKNNITGHYVEPYAGGASVALHLLLNGYVKEISINDYDRAIYAFWYSVLNHTDKLCRKIRYTDVTVKNWRKFKKVHSNKDQEGLFKLGFATLFLNRTNRSGILDGGIIGGIDQSGEYKIDCRFNKEELIKRIRLIAKHKKNIHLYHLDALALVDHITNLPVCANTIFYFDPPYYLKGPSLYMSHYKHADHKKVSEKIRQIENMQWIVSYDNTKEIKSLYSNLPTIEYSFFHTAFEIREGKELLFFSSGLTVPNVSTPTMICSR